MTPQSKRDVLKFVRVPNVQTDAKACKTQCDKMGICLVLDDCQDQHRIDAATKKPQPTAMMGQSRLHSLSETLSSIAVGFVVSLLLQAVVLPLYGHHITLSQNVQITVIFTVASVLRTYAMRRLFNHLHKGGVL